LRGGKKLIRRLRRSHRLEGTAVHRLKRRRRAPPNGSPAWPLPSCRRSVVSDRRGASALLLASVGLSWRFRLFRNQRTDSPVPAAFSPQNGLPALSFSESSGLLPFRPLVEKVRNFLAFLKGRFRESSTLRRSRTGAARNGGPSAYPHGRGAHYSAREAPNAGPTESWHQPAALPLVVR